MKTMMVGTRQYAQVSTPRPNGRWFCFADMQKRMGFAKAIYWWMHQRINWSYHSLRFDYWQYTHNSSTFYNRTSKMWIAKLRGYAGDPWYKPEKNIE